MKTLKYTTPLKEISRELPKPIKDIQYLETKCKGLQLFGAILYELDDTMLEYDSEEDADYEDRSFLASSEYFGKIPKIAAEFVHYSNAPYIWVTDRSNDTPFGMEDEDW